MSSIVGAAIGVFGITGISAVIPMTTCETLDDVFDDDHPKLIESAPFVTTKERTPAPPGDNKHWSVVLNCVSIKELNGPNVEESVDVASSPQAKLMYRPLTPGVNV